MSACNFQLPPIPVPPIKIPPIPAATIQPIIDAIQAILNQALIPFCPLD